VLYELRTYEIAPWRMPAIIDRFTNVTMTFFRRHGVKPVLYLEPVIGKSNEFVYLVQWSDLAERERCWTAFMTDPEWIAARAETERDGPIVLSYTAHIFKDVPQIIDAYRALGNEVDR